MPAHPHLVIEQRKTSLSPYVDLDAVRNSGNELCSLVNGRVRREIRRAIRLYEEMGELRIERALTKKDALKWLQSLRDLHQARWTARGQPGAFARPFFGRFLRALIDRGLSKGVIDILRITAGERELGYLYNFVYRDRVSNYQSGFQFGPDGRYKPGLVAHSLAAGHYATDTKLKRYSLLAGASQYKRSLCSGLEELSWYCYRRTSRLPGLAKVISAIATRLGS